MSKKKLLCFVLAALLAAGFTEGCKSHKGHRGRRQPKHGPMPCPVKDC